MMEIYPAHVVCQWIGNSEAAARKHYLQVTDAHFEKAVFSTSTLPVAHQVAQNIGEPERMETIVNDVPIEETQCFSTSFVDVRDGSCGENNPTRARTWNDRTKICCWFIG
mgnify:CR=1 FL=1